jgi:hypothetical protein
VCAYYSKPCQKPENCCEAPGCHPGPPADLDKITSDYVKKLEKACGMNSVQLAKDNRDLPKYEKEMLKISLECLTEWQDDIWVRRREQGVLTNLDPLNFMVTDHVLNRLVSSFHQAITEECTLHILDQWIHIFTLNFNMEEKSSLIQVVSACNARWMSQRMQTQKRGGAKKGNEARKRTRAQVQQEDDDNGYESTGEPEAEPMSAGVLSGKHTAGKRQVRLTAKAMEADIHEED